jgi:TolB-like protein/class 3 adenylate cyclase/Tfp pilus assembly protein PilF
LYICNFKNIPAAQSTFVLKPQSQEPEMTQEGFKRKLTAILSADVIGYSRLMRDDEEATVRDLAAHRVLINEIIQQHNGRVVDSPGDNILAEFASVVDAVNGAIKIQTEITKSNTGVPEDRRMEFRIGVNLGDVIEEDERIYGDGVNIAARVEGLAAGGGIAISGTVYEHIKEKLSLGYHYLGEQEVKNISEPVRIYRLLTEPADAGKMIGEEKPKSNKLLWAAAAAIVLIILSVCTITIKNYYFRPSFEPASVEKMAFPLPEKPSIAVLPFDNMSGDPEQNYIADGFTENIITGLSQIPQMFVIARNSVFTYKGKPVKVKQVSEELGVKYILEGSVQKAGDRLRVNAQFIDALKGHHLWAERYDRELKDLFDLQDEITVKILNTLHMSLIFGPKSTYSEWNRTDSFEAWSLWTKGWSSFNHPTKMNNSKAREYFKQALQLDSDYAAAWEILAWTHLSDVSHGYSDSPEESIKRTLEIAKHKSKHWGPGAIHFLMCSIYSIQRNYEKAIAEGKKAIELYPNSSRRHLILANALNYGARPEEAIIHVKKAMRLEPYYPAFFLLTLFISYDQAGRYEEALEVKKELLERANKGAWPLNNAHQHLSVSYARLDRMEEARAHAEVLLKIDPDFSVKKWRKSPAILLFKDQKWLDSIAEMLLKAGLPEHPPLKLPNKPSIAVLPFVNMSGDQEQEYFSDGISEEIITALSKTPKLFVIARTSSFKYKDKEVDIRTVGRELGVRYVLEGSVRKAGDKVRITAQLIDATTEKHLWAERYDRNLREIFAIQDEITLAIIKAMQVELTKGEMTDMTGRGTKNLDAYLKALQAQEQWQRMDKQGTMKAKQLALEAIAIDEQYGWPYAIVSWSHMMDVWLQSSESPKESMRLAAEAIQKALTLDEFDYRIHSVLSNLYIMQGKNDEAIASAQRALELCPGGAFAHAVLGTALRFACRFSEAVQFREQAIKLDPYPTALDYRNLAVAYSKVGRYEDAIAEYKKALQTNTNDWAVYYGLVEAYAKLNRKVEARNAAEELLRVRPDFSLNWLTETAAQMYAKECRSKIMDDLEFLRNEDVGLQ